MMDMFATLNRLLQLHSRSLAVYLLECLPWTSLESTSKGATLREIGESQRDMADRIAERIMTLGGVPDLGDFPLNFTGLNDLSLEYLLGVLVKAQRRNVQAISECVAALRDGPEGAVAIAEEAHGAALGYLDQLVELTQPAATTS